MTRKEAERLLAAGVGILPEGDHLYMVAGGIKLALRGAPGSPYARQWISLEPGWTVRDVDYPREFELLFDNVPIH